MPTQLLRLAVRNVSAVDRPANQRTFLTIKAEDAMTFADALMLQRMRDVYEALSERYGALMETMDSIRQSEEPDKLAACHAALDAFAQSVSTDVPALMAVMSRAPDPDDDTNNSVTKAGRKISAARFAKLKTLYTVLGEIMQEGAETMTETTKASVPDMSALTKIGQSLAALFGRAAGADAATIAALEGAPEPTISKADIVAQQAAHEALQKANTDLATQLAAVREQIELRKFAEEVSGYTSIGLDPAKDAAVLKSVTEKLPAEHAARIREIFKAAVAQAAASKLFTEVGSGAVGAPAGSAAEELDQLLNTEMAKSATTTLEQARDRVFRTHRGLYDRVRAEQNTVKT